MKVILICLLLATVAFADIVESSDVSFLPYLALANQFLGEKLNVQFNATEFALGLNQGFGLATNEAALACANSVVPALEYLEVVSQEITQLQWGQVFNQTSTLINNVQEFQTECETVYNSYADYFGAAADAYNNDQEAFLKAVRANLLKTRPQLSFKLSKLLSQLLTMMMSMLVKALLPLSKLPSKATSQIN